MSETPRPTPPQSTRQAQPTQEAQPAQPTQQAQPPAQAGPTPASVSGDVPVEAWRARLAETKEAPAAERHERLGALLDDLDAQVGSL